MANPPFRLENEDYTLSLESYGGFYFVHNEVHRWSPAICRELRHVIDTLADMVELRVFCDPGNTKLMRYAGLFGFTPDHTARSPEDGRVKQILIRRTTHGRTI